MLSALRVKNFKCLRDVQLEFDPLTVLIGKNDTGKSSLLDAIYLLAQLVRGNNDAFVGPWSVDNLLAQGAEDRTITWEATVQATPKNGLPGTARYVLRICPGKPFGIVEEKVAVDGAEVTIERGSQSHSIRDSGSEMRIGDSLFHDTLLAWGARDRAKFPNLHRLASALTSTTKYALDPRRLATESTFLPSEHPEPRLRHDGLGLPSVLGYMLGARRKSFAAIEDRVREVAHFVRGVAIKPAVVAGGTGGIRGDALCFLIGDDEEAEVPAPQVSEGILLLLGYLTIVHAPSRPGIILLEEPENGIHPHLLESTVGILRSMVEDSASDTRVVAATHSPYLLDFVAPECVRVFGRRNDGSTVIARLADLPGVQERIASGLSVGEMWFNVGEDRLLAGLLA